METASKLDKKNDPDQLEIDNNEINNQQKRMTLTPEQIQVLVMRQLNHVNAKKDELNIAIKQLGDLATQLGNICAQQNKLLSKTKDEKVN